MKKILTLAWAILLFGGISLLAAPVPAERALEIGKKILAAQPATKAGTGQISIVWDGESADVATKSSVQPAFYVIARDGGGFVIIAGDDNAQPVLAISPDGRFATEGMPENVKWWMEQMKRYVHSAAKPSQQIRDRWTDLAQTKAPLSPVDNENTTANTVEWDQGAPANFYSPVITGEYDGKSVTGCLPLAMAEILTWFGYPAKGTGDIPGYTYYAQTGASIVMPGYTMETEYNWTALQALDTYEKFSNCTDEDVRLNLAQLVFDCGMLLEAEFNSAIAPFTGTSASESAVAAAFYKHMGYSRDARVLNAVDYTPSQWTQILKEQVAQHPLLYCGISPGSDGNEQAMPMCLTDLPPIMTKMSFISILAGPVGAMVIIMRFFRIRHPRRSTPSIRIFGH